MADDDNDDGWKALEYLAVGCARLVVHGRGFAAQVGTNLDMLVLLLMRPLDATWMLFCAVLTSESCLLLASALFVLWGEVCGEDRDPFHDGSAFGTQVQDPSTVPLYGAPKLGCSDKKCCLASLLSFKVDGRLAVSGQELPKLDSKEFQ
eukprot:378579-Pelagomonas_calceolata.AAC.2